MEKSKNSSQDRYRTSENNESNAHWQIFFPLLSKMFTNVAYISASVNIVKISIIIVSRQMHSSWNKSHAAALNALVLIFWRPFLNFKTTSAHAARNWTNHSNWFANRFTGLPTGLIKPLNKIDSKEWIIRVWVSLVAQRKVDGTFEINLSIF